MAAVLHVENQIINYQICQHLALLCQLDFSAFSQQQQNLCQSAGIFPHNHLRGLQRMVRKKENIQ